MCQGTARCPQPVVCNVDEEMPLLRETEVDSILEKTSLFPQVNVEKEAPPTELFGYGLMIMTGVFFATGNLLVHTAEAMSGFPALSSVFVRSVVHTSLATAYLLPFPSMRKSVYDMTRRQKLTILFRGVIGSFDLVSLYMALGMIPVGDATTLFFLCPAFTLLLSHAFLSEPLTAWDILAVAVSLSGATLISRPDAATATAAVMIPVMQRIMGSLLAVTAAFLAACAYTSIRSLGLSFNFMTSILSLGFFSLLVSTALGGAMSPSMLAAYGKAGVAVVIGAILTFFAQVTLTTGLQRCRAGRGVLVNAMEVPVSYGLGLLFLGERPTMGRGFGAMLIVAAVIMIGGRQILKRRREGC